MKKFFILLFICKLMMSCGVPHEEHENLKSKIDSLELLIQELEFKGICNDVNKACSIEDYEKAKIIIGEFKSNCKDSLINLKLGNLLIEVTKKDPNYTGDWEIGYNRLGKAILNYKKLITGTYSNGYDANGYPLNPKMIKVKLELDHIFYIRMYIDGKYIVEPLDSDRFKFTIFDEKYNCYNSAFTYGFDVWGEYLLEKSPVSCQIDGEDKLLTLSEMLAMVGDLDMTIIQYNSKKKYNFKIPADGFVNAINKISKHQK